MSNNKSDLINYVKENWKKIPYLCNMSEEGISEFLEKGETNKIRADYTEYLAISKRHDAQGEFEVIETKVEGVNQEDDKVNEEDNEEYFLTSQMSFDDKENFGGTIYGLNTRFSINKDGEIEFKANNKEQNELLQNLIQNREVVTHFGDDLDNKSSIYAIKNYLKSLGIIEKGEDLTVNRVRAGQVKEGVVNVDTGGHKGNRIEDETKTVVIDGDPKNGVKSAAQSLSGIGIYVPEQICELADTMPARVSPLDSRSGLALVRYLSEEQVFKLAENHLLDKSLTDEQLEEFGLTESHEKQQKIIDNAVEKINKYTVELQNGEKAVLAPEQILAGSIIAYEMGIPYYASTSQHRDKEGNPDGVTFAISSKPGIKLPKDVMQYGKELVEKYRIDEKSSGVFLNPNGQMLVAGGSKNPDFKIEGYTPKEMLAELKSVLSQSRDSFLEEIFVDAKKREEVSEKSQEAEQLTKEYEKKFKTNQQSL